MVKQFKHVNPNIVCIVALLFSITFIHGQDQTFKHLTPRDGLAAGYVYTIMQDDKGFIWIGTNAGLGKYDGYSFINYRPDNDDPKSIAGGLVYAIEQYDQDHLVIASSLGIEVFSLSTGQFELLKLPPSLPSLEASFDLIVTPSSEVYASSIHGIYYFSDILEKGENPEIEFFPFEHTSEITETPARVVMGWDRDKTIYVNRLNSLERLYLPNKKINKIDFIVEDVDAVLRNVWDIFVDSRGDLLITSTSGLVVWKKGEDFPKVIAKLGPYGNKELSAASFQSISEDSEGNLWLGTGTLGAIRWNPDTNEVQTFRNNTDNQNSINSDDVHYAFVDEQDNTWFGYHNMGLSLMYSNTFNYRYKLADDSVDKDSPLNDIFTIKDDEAGNLWFATAGGLVQHLSNGQRETFQPNPQQPKRNSLGNMDIMEEKIFMISDTLNEMYVFDIKEHTTKALPMDINIEGVRFISFSFSQSEESYYLGNLDGKIIEIKKGNYEVSTTELPYSDSYTGLVKPVLPFYEENGSLTVYAIQVSTAGPPSTKVYTYDLKTDNLSELNFEELSSATGIFGIPSKSPNEVGVYWIRRGNGILKINVLTQQTELLFTSESGVLVQSSGFLLEDNDGFLWTTTDTGFIKLDPLTQSISYFETEMGRRPNNLFIGSQLSNGNLIYPGKGGYIEFDPKDLQQEDNIPYIHITELNSGENIYNILYSDIPIEIESSNNNLSFSYLGLNYRDPAFTRYRYRIKGYDDNWVSVGTQQRVFLANLPPGSYTFEVQAAPRFGAFGENSASVNFKIPPPWWRTWPAYLLYALIFIVGIVIFDRIQRRRVLARERERSREKELQQAREIEVAYENLKATQNKLIQSEKMASLGELTAGIAHEIQNPLNFVNNFSEINQELALELKEELKKGDIDVAMSIADDIKENEIKISHHGKRADSIVKGMLQHSRNHSGERVLTDINNLIDEYLRLAYHGMRAKDKTFNASLETDFDQSIEKLIIVPQDIGRVALNIINNSLFAIKEKQMKIDDSTYKPTVWVSTKKENDNISIIIKDNGMGIPADVKDKIFLPFFTTKPAGQGTGLGLSMSYDIVTKGHGGELLVETEDNKGTIFRIVLPITSINKK